MVNTREITQKLKNSSLTELETIDWLGLIKQASNSTDDQLSLILLAIKADQCFYGNINNVMKQVKNIINQHLRIDVKISKIGCTSNALALKSCMVDLVITSNKVSFENEEDSLHRIEDVLKTFPGVLQDVKLITDVTPTIQFKSLGMCFGLAFPNDLTLYYDLLINKFVQCEEKIKNLILIIKFWIMKRINDCKKLKTSALSFLVLYYLQRQFKVNGICDSIDEHGKMIYGWFVEVTDLKGLDHSLLKDLSLVKLLENFFDFYSNFDFQSCAVCPYVGQEVLKIHLNNPYKLPPEYFLLKEDILVEPRSYYKTDDQLYIQDPFCHTQNLTPDVDAKLMKKIKKNFVVASQIFKKNEANIFHRLFSSKSYQA